VADQHGVLLPVVTFCVSLPAARRAAADRRGVATIALSNIVLSNIALSKIALSKTAISKKSRDGFRCRRFGNSILRTPQ